IQPVKERCYTNTCFFGKLCHCYSPKGRIYQPAVPLVPAVDFPAYPSAISGIITLLVVDAIQFQSFLISWPHIFPESFEAFCPLLADRYTTSAVVVIGRMIPIHASLLHGMPHTKCRMVSHPMCGFRFGYQFCAHTSA